MRKICVVTGARAEYGLLYWLIKDIQEDADLEILRRNVGSNVPRRNALGENTTLKTEAVGKKE